MLIRSFIAILALLVAVGFPVPAGAAATDECQAQISTLRSDTATTAFVNPQDEAGLLGKLDNASAALTAGKNADAIKKLTDFRTKVQVLGSTGKLAAEDARLDAGAAAAIGCVQSIGA
jgi:hypothetical protein